MAKAKNHSTHHKNRKDHRNGIKKPRSFPERKFKGLYPTIRQDLLRKYRERCLIRNKNNRLRLQAYRKKIGIDEVINTTLQHKHFEGILKRQRAKEILKASEAKKLIKKKIEAKIQAKASKVVRTEAEIKERRAKRKQERIERKKYLDLTLVQSDKIRKEKKAELKKKNLAKKEELKKKLVEKKAELKKKKEDRKEGLRKKRVEGVTKT